MPTLAFIGLDTNNRILIERDVIYKDAKEYFSMHSESFETHVKRAFITLNALE